MYVAQIKAWLKWPTTEQYYCKTLHYLSKSKVRAIAGINSDISLDVWCSDLNVTEMAYNWSVLL